MKIRKLTTGMIVIAAVILFSMLGCEEVIDPDYVSPGDSIAALSMVDSANASLEALMDAMYTADPDSVQDLLDILDYSEPYALYVAAHELNPKNSDANFGLAFTGFLMLSQDDQLQEMLLRWESFFNIHEPFAVTEPEPSLPKSGFGLPLTIDGIRIPISPIIGTPIALTKMSIDDVPQFSEFQNLIESLFLPVIEESINALDIVDDSSNFVFMISPAMQGEIEAEPLELDLTEIYALEMGLYGLKSVLKTVVAYDFDFVSFDSVGIVTELSQGSEFATLKSGGAADLSAAHTSANTAVQKALAALDFLAAETDDQSNDLIQISGEGDIDEVRGYILEAQSTLSEPTMIHFEYWEDIYDDDGNWIGDELVEDSINVDISNFFTNPITDFKAMLPPYTMGTSTYFDYEHSIISEHITYEETEVSVPGLNNENIIVTLDYSYNNGDPISQAWVNLGFSYDLTTTNVDDLPVSVWELYVEFQALIFEYSNELYNDPHISFFWSGNVTTGSSLTIDGDFSIAYEQLVNPRVEPALTWVAGTYSEWLLAWPDPTMHEIFPDLDGAGIAEFLGIDEENWLNFTH